MKEPNDMCLYGNNIDGLTCDLDGLRVMAMIVEMEKSLLTMEC